MRRLPLNIAVVPRIAGTAAILGGVLVHAGWQFEIPFLTQPMADASAMMATTATMFVAVGAALWLLSANLLPRFVVFLGVLVGVTGVLSLGHVVFGQNFTLDQLWLVDQNSPGRMSPFTAVCYAALGPSLVASARKGRAWAAHGLALLAALVAIVVSIGYLYKVSNLVGIGLYVSMAPHTAGLMLAVCIGVLCLEPTEGVMAILTADTLGGQMARRTLPASIGIPIVLGWLRLAGEQAGLYNPKVGPPLVVLGSMVFVSIVIWLNAKLLGEVDAKRHRAEGDLRRANEELESRVAEKTAEAVLSQREAAESAELFFRLFEFAPDAIVAVNHHGVIERANAKTEEVFGYTRKELIGRPVEILIPDHLSARHAAHRRGALEESKARAMGEGRDLLARHKDGAEFPVDVMLSPTDSPRGQLVLAVVRDISERRQAEAAIRVAEDRLRAGQRLEAMGQLAGGVAHDFNNMMTVVSGYSELLLGQVQTDDPIRRALQEIKKAGDRCAKLTGHLLAFSRRQMLAPSLLDLNAIVADLCNMLPMLLGEKIEVATVTDPDLWRVRADPAQIEQVIVNLVVNARDAMPDGGTLLIETCNARVDRRTEPGHPEIAPGPYVLLSITDNGQGMDAETKARVFDPFFTTKPVGQGTGLGLSTAYGVINQSGGHICLDSTPGLGTAFRIYLPRVEASDAPAPRVTERRLPHGLETVLLAEDEEALRRFLRQVLEGSGYRVIEAADASQALALGAQHAQPIDLLLSDVVMPGVGGGKLAEQFRLTHPETAVLFMSGYAQDDIVGHAAATNGATFLAKPFTANALLTRVREMLDARPVSGDIQ